MMLFALRAMRTVPAAGGRTKKHRGTDAQLRRPSYIRLSAAIGSSHCCAPVHPPCPPGFAFSSPPPKQMPENEANSSKMVSTRQGPKSAAGRNHFETVFTEAMEGSQMEVKTTAGEGLSRLSRDLVVMVEVVGVGDVCPVWTSGSGGEDEIRLLFIASTGPCVCSSLVRSHHPPSTINRGRTNLRVRRDPCGQWPSAERGGSLHHI